MPDQLGLDMIKALRDTSIPPSVRLRNAAVLSMQYPLGIRSRFMQYTDALYQIIHEVFNTFAEGDEIETGFREITVDPPSKEAVRSARKQSLICQVLIAGSDAQTMTGIRPTRNHVG